MKLTIIVEDGGVIVDGIGALNLDFSAYNIPANIHALQWNNDKGWIEYVDVDGEKEPNLAITELPEWANLCVTAFKAL